MNKHISVEGHNDLVRDKNSGVILNINTKEVELARERKRKRKLQEQELQNLKDEVSEIKSLLNKIIERI